MAMAAMAAMGSAGDESSCKLVNCYYGYNYHYWLVVLTILKNMSKSMGRIIPHIMENKIHV